MRPPTDTWQAKPPFSGLQTLQTLQSAFVCSCAAHENHPKPLLQADPTTPSVNAGLPTQGHSAVIRNIASSWGLHHRQHYGTAAGAGCCLCGVNLATNLCPAPWISSDCAPAGTGHAELSLEQTCDLHLDFSEAQQL